MAENDDYEQVELSDRQKKELKEYPDVHLKVLGMKLDLPNLRSSRLPIEIVQIGLLLRSHTELDEQTQSQAMSVFLAYFQSMRPDFWNRIRKSDYPLDWLAATIDAWARQSNITDKSLFTPSASGSDTASR